VSETPSAAVRVLEVDDDDVRLDIGNSPGDAGNVVNDRHLAMAGLSQAFLYDRRTDAVLVDDQDAQAAGSHPHLVRALSHELQ